MFLVAVRGDPVEKRGKVLSGDEWIGCGGLGSVKEHESSVMCFCYGELG
jgi:hypothetical protein